jgi:3-oxoacyl-[acyl-carrier protein] reductase
MGLALVTGATGGIGRAIARRLAADGWRTALQGNSRFSEAEALAAELRAAGCCARAYAGDLADPGSVSSLLETVRREQGQPSLLVYGAGVSFWGLVQDTSPEDWDRLFAVNTRSAFLCARGVLPGMLSAGSGCIVFISSMWGVLGASCEAAYSASKAALHGFTQALAREVGPSGIRVNCIAPGVVDTDMMASFSPEDKAALVERTPLCRLGAPEDVAAAVAFLAGNEASFITGQILSVDGGFLL